MVVLFTYQQLVERNSDQIHVCWKLTVITMCLLAVATGISSAYSMGTLVNLFEGRCILEANLTFANKTELGDSQKPNSKFDDDDLFRRIKHVHIKHGRMNSYGNDFSKGYNNSNDMVLDLSNSEWNNIQLCEWYQLAGVMSAVMGVVWLTFFTMCSRGGRVSVGLPNPSRLVLPSIPCFLILGVCGIAASTELNHGMMHFCTEFRSILDIYECGPETDRFTPAYGQTVPAHVLIRTAVAGSWLGASSWMVAFTILLLRVLFMVDFDLITITVATKPESGISFSKQGYLYRTASNEGILRVHDPRASLDAVRLRVIPVVKSGRNAPPAIIKSTECTIPPMKNTSKHRGGKWFTRARKLGIKKSKSDIDPHRHALKYISSEQELNIINFEAIPAKSAEHIQSAQAESEKSHVSLKELIKEPPVKRIKIDKSLDTHEDNTVDISTGVRSFISEDFVFPDWHHPHVAHGSLYSDGELSGSQRFKEAMSKVIAELITNAIDRKLEEIFSQTETGTITHVRPDLKMSDSIRRAIDNVSINDTEREIRQWSAEYLDSEELFTDVLSSTVDEDEVQEGRVTKLNFQVSDTKSKRGTEHLKEIEDAKKVASSKMQEDLNKEKEMDKIEKQVQIRLPDSLERFRETEREIQNILPHDEELGEISKKDNTRELLKETPKALPPLNRKEAILDIAEKGISNILPVERSKSHDDISIAKGELKKKQNIYISEPHPIELSRNKDVTNKTEEIAVPLIPHQKLHLEDGSTTDKETENIEKKMHNILPKDAEFPRESDDFSGQKPISDNEGIENVDFMKDKEDWQSGPSSSKPPGENLPQDGDGSLTKEEEQKGEDDDDIDDDDIYEEVAQILPRTFAALIDLAKTEYEKRKSQTKPKEDKDKDEDQK